MKINSIVSTLPDKLKAAIEKVELTVELIIHSFENGFENFKTRPSFLSCENSFVNILEYFQNGGNMICHRTIIPQDSEHF